jgi:hypothetical protein
VAKALPPIQLNGVEYSVLRLDRREFGPLYLLRDTAGRLFGVYGRNAQTALSAAPLELKLTADNPFRGLDFFETAEGRLLMRS